MQWMFSVDAPLRLRYCPRLKPFFSFPNFIKKIGCSDSHRRTVILRTDTLWLLLLTSLIFVSPITFTGKKTFAQDRKAEISQPEGAAPASPDISLPPVGERGDNGSNLSTSIKVHVREIRLAGNTVFPASQISRITSPYENRSITQEELQQLRHQLTLLYVDSGYINSGVIIPDQKVEGGIITLQAVEGSLSEIRISGNARIHETYIAKRIARLTGPPLNVNTLQEGLQLLHQNPLIRRINASLGPGVHSGEGELNVDITEDRPYMLHLECSNHHAPSVGGERLRVHLAHLNVTGWGDAIGGRYGTTDGMDDFYAYYRLPVTAKDTTIEIYYEKNDAVVVEEPFDRVDINSESKSYGISLTHPLIRKPGKTLNLSLKAEKRHSETFVLGELFSFAPGVVYGKSDVAVLRFSQEWIDRSTSRVLALRSVFSVGIDALDATINESDPDSRFLTWLGQAQLAKRFPEFWDGQLILRTDLQLAESSLLPIEQFPLGGAASVRGYRENQLIRDNGISASVEMRLPVWRLPLPKISRTAEDGILQLASFADFGWGWNTDLPTPDLDTIYSVGMGIRWDPSEKMHAEVYWGYPLRDVNNPNQELQDAGIHFQFTWRMF